MMHPPWSGLQCTRTGLGTWDLGIGQTWDLGIGQSQWDFGLGVGQSQWDRDRLVLVVAQSDVSLYNPDSRTQHLF